MKQVKGFIESILVERFRQGRITFLTISCTQGPGFESPVTLSPVGQESKPDHKAMWGEAMRYLTVMFAATKISQKILTNLDQIEREHGGEGFLTKHTPRPDEGTKPEGKDELGPPPIDYPPGKDER